MLFRSANDGNITVRISDNELLTTPTGVSKGFMTMDMIIKMNMDGKVLQSSPKYRPSSEVKMHMEVYRQREDVKSVVHAHPPFCTSFAVAGIPLDKCVLPEAVIVLGAVPIAPYGTPSTMEIPDSIAKHTKNTDAILLANHGALTFGTDLFSAYHRMETLEHTAQIIHTSIQLGNVNMIPADQVNKLMQVRDKLGVSSPIYKCGEASGSSCENETVSNDQIEAITRAVVNRIKNSGN
mgnify:FL=1